jgi:hypothetical protein
MADNTSKNPFQTKPIESVKNDLHTINRNLNQLKTDVICIKSDLSIIREIIKKKEAKENEISKGWLWS